MMGLFRRQVSIKDVLFVFIILVLVSLLIFVILKKAPEETQYKSSLTDFGLKDVGKLVTQEGFYTSVQSIDGARKIFGIDVPFTEKKYIYTYDGTVSAGIDFEQIDQTIDEESHSIVIELPEPEIFTVETDYSSFNLYHEGDNPFNGLHISEVNESQKEMDYEIRQKALENGILEHAAENAKHLVKAFLWQSFDKDQWSITIKQKEA